VRNTLTTSRELPAYEDAANPLLCPKESEHSALLSVPTKVAHLFLAAYPPFVCHARPILHISREPYHYNEERTRVHAITCGNRQMLTNPGGEGARWGVPQLGSGKGENLQYIGIVHLNLGRRICPNISRENLLHKACCCFCVLRLCCL
jgi:hypothetical protein